MPTQKYLVFMRYAPGKHEAPAGAGGRVQVRSRGNPSRRPDEEACRYRTSRPMDGGGGSIMPALHPPTTMSPHHTSGKTTSTVSPR